MFKLLDKASYLAVQCTMPLGTQLKKGVLEICILAVIGQESIYGYDLIEKIQDAGLVLTEGTLYPILSRLRQEGLVTSIIKESTAGPSRRYYALSKKGEAVLKNGVQEFQEFTASVNKLLFNKNV